MLKNMKVGNIKYFLFYFLLFSVISFSVSSEDKIQTVPLVNLEELSPTFEEDKEELEKVEYKSFTLEENKDISNELKSSKNKKIYINLTALDKITAKTSSFRMAVGDKKSFGPLEIKALKCQVYESNQSSDTVAYIQVKDLSTKDNDQVFLFNGWTFASSPTLKSIDHPIYDLWITSCENI